MPGNTVYKKRVRLLNKEVRCLKCQLSTCQNQEVGGGGEVYYNRAWLLQTVSYDDYDEAWRVANGANDYMEAIPDNGLVQRIDATNEAKDKLFYFNIWEHKFRFTGLTGGYYDPSDGNYYTVAGVLSDKATEFPFYVAARAFIIDHLTGFMMISDRLGTTTYYINLVDADAASVEGYEDWFAIAMVEWLKLYDSYAVNLNASHRPPWNMTQSLQQSCSPRSTFETTHGFYFTAAYGGGTSQHLKGNATSNRAYWRIHLTGTIPQP